MVILRWQSYFVRLELSSKFIFNFFKILMDYAVNQILPVSALQKDFEQARFIEVLIKNVTH